MDLNLLLKMLNFLKHVIAVVLIILITLGIPILVLNYDNGDENSDGKSVRVDYCIYTPVKELKKTTVIKIKGEKFIPRYTSHKGTNRVYITDTSKNYGLFNTRPIVEIYEGTDYCDVVKITILE